MASMGYEKTGKRWRVFWHVTLHNGTVDKGSKSFKDKKNAKKFKEHCEKREKQLKNAISTTSRKTKKSMASRPVSAEIMAELSKYVCGLDVGQQKLFRTKFNHRKWRKVCKKSGLADLKFHDLRKTFCSLLAQNGVSTAVTQRLLEHSSPNLTNRVYTNVDPVLRHAVEQLPVGDWL